MFRSIGALENALVVSCQAAPGNPLENVDVLRRIALVAIDGGAGGLRLNSAECIAAIRPETRIPIIGIKKVHLNGRTRITPDFASAVELAQSGADIIALDCTSRIWPDGDPWQQLIERIHRELNLPVMADIATVEEARAAAAAGADMIGTTLNGYTEQTQNNSAFSWPLLADLIEQTSCPVIAEGHISTPAEARRAILAGAWCVVVGSAITRPGDITSNFVRSIQCSRNSGPVIAVDIGGTSIKAGLVDRKGHISNLTRISTTASGGREVIASATSLAIDQVLQSARREGIEPVGLGIASAGVIDAQTGTVLAATDNLPGWSGFHLREFAEEQFRIPTRVENDAHAAALAEMYFGAGRHLNNFAAITIGTGLGGGIVLDRRLIRGQHGFAGGFGHSSIRINGRPCTCGRTGCLEAYVSAAALALEYKDRGGWAGCETGIDDAALALKVSQLASAKDPIALEAYSVLAGYLAEGIANLLNVLDLDAVLVSGGIVEGHPEFVADIERRVHPLLHFAAQRKPSVRLATGGYQSGILGAAAAVFNFQPEAEV